MRTPRKEKKEKEILKPRDKRGPPSSARISRAGFTPLTCDADQFFNPHRKPRIIQEIIFGIKSDTEKSHELLRVAFFVIAT